LRAGPVVYNGRVHGATRNYCQGEEQHLVPGLQVSVCLYNDQIANLKCT
jgi:hypothetical protein